MEKIHASKLLAGLVPARLPHQRPGSGAGHHRQREVRPGCIFVAFPGERFDGHDFVPQAIAAGAVAAVTEQPIEGCPCLVVENTGRALLKIARFYREKFHPVLVGVTGSVGKTTTKEMIACVLESQFCTLKTQGNLNNEIGLPKTLMQLEEQHTAAVIEMGMSHFGEISRLSRTAEPSMGVITNIGYSHIENLKTQEGILQAKLEILDGMAADAPLIVNGDNALLAPLKRNLPRPVITYGMHAEKLDVRAEDVVRNADSTTFTIAAADGKKYPAMLRCVGDHNVMNALAAFCVGTQAGIAPEKICAALERYQTVGMRQNISHRGAYTIIADCYNASPDSMKAALTVLRELPCKTAHCRAGRHAGTGRDVPPAAHAGGRYGSSQRSGRSVLSGHGGILHCPAGSHAESIGLPHRGSAGTVPCHSELSASGRCCAL